MAPADQRLDAGQLAGARVHLGLIEHLELVVLDRLGQIALERLARLQPRIHARLEEAQRRAPVLLGAGHHHAGDMQRALGRVGLARQHDRGDADADRDLLVADGSGCASSSCSALASRCAACASSTAGRTSTNSSAPRRRDHVARLRQVGQPLRHGADQLVADDRAVDVVDLLEPVEVEQQEGRPSWSRRRAASSSSRRALDQPLAVQQAGQRVVAAQELGGLACLDLDRDVGGGAAPADVAARHRRGWACRRPASARGRPSRSR